MKQIALLITSIIVIYIGLINSGLAESHRGNMIVRQEDGRCEYQAYAFSEGNSDFFFNFSGFRRKFTRSVDLNALESMSVIDRPCQTARFGRNTKVVIGLNRCFVMSLRRIGTYTLCPKNEEFDLLYQALFTSIKEFSPLSPGEMEFHKNLLQYYRDFTDYDTSIRRTPEQLAAAPTRTNPMKGERHSNLTYSVRTGLKEGGGGKVFAGKVLRRNGSEFADCIIKSHKLYNDDSDPNSLVDEAISMVNEVKLISVMGRHRNLVRLYDAAAFNTAVYMVQERLSGDLEDLQMKSEPKITDKYDLYEVAKDFLRGVAYLHKKGIYHFDIKPANVMVQIINKTLDPSSDTDVMLGDNITADVISHADSTLTSKVIDFGFSKHRLFFESDQSFYDLGHRPGSDGYHCPEEMQRGKLICKTDRCMSMKDSWAAGFTILDALVAPLRPKWRKRIVVGDAKPGMELRAGANEFYRDILNDEEKKELEELGILELAETALKLTEEDPDKRITAQQAYNRLSYQVQLLKIDEFF